MSTKQLTLVLGGARSGKSSFAEERAGQSPAPVTYVATMWPGDEELRERVERHRERRPPEWSTVEVTRAVGRALGPVLRQPGTVLLECLSLVVANLLGDFDDGEPARERDRWSGVEAELTELLRAYDTGQASLIVVSNEVGMGLVPPYPLGRLYRDLLGRANQLVAARADDVYLLVAGLPLAVKRRTHPEGTGDRRRADGATG